MSKAAVALGLLTLCVSPISAAEIGHTSPIVSIAFAPAEWIYLGRFEDPETGEIVYLWEWSEYPLRTTTFTKTPPPPPVDRQGIGQS
ncbi:MAG: hypothetical protein JNM84_10770 [Planctomycetes bacterium]|nr:hypothetical protein [Planctomycetota bacterium]